MARIGSGNAAGVLPRVHLASQSPRRRELLSAAGIEHDAAHPGLDDGQLATPDSGEYGHVNPSGWVMALAYLKAASAQRGGLSIAAPVVLGADTVVVHRGRLLGQPKDAADARRMIVEMRDDVHDVITGVALVDARTGARDIFADRAVVRVGSIADDEIDRYVATGQWKGKAGAYNLSERLAAGWPITYEGDAGTIMGLPMGKLVDRLRVFGARAA